jgi:PAS domain S-box-containing protein
MLFGLEKNQPITLDQIMEFIHPEDFSDFKNAVQKAINNNLQADFEYRVILPDGTLKYHYIKATTIIDKENIPVKLFGTIQDITERKSTEIQLIKTEKSLKEELKVQERFLSIINHDIKAPLFSIDNILEWIENNYDKTNNTKVKELIRVVRDSAHSAYLIIEDLVTWARSTKIEGEYNPEINPIKPLVDDCIKFLNVNAMKKNIRFNSLITDNERGYFDKKMITVVIRNLISNAIKFSYENSSIEIKAKTENHFIDISVIDHGMGITKENQNKLFNIDNIFTTYGTSHEEGTGLGLILCSNFIKINQGKIRAESEEKKGTSFTISLPISNTKP